MFQDPATRRLNDFIVPADLHSLDVGQSFRSTKRPRAGADYTIASAVDWYGPYASLSTARQACRQLKIDKGLYLVIGSSPQDAGEHVPLLVAMGAVGDRLDEADQYDQLDETAPFEVWIGKMAQPLIDMKRSAQRPDDFWQSKWAWVYGLQPALNTYMRVNPPKHRVVVRNYYGGRRDMDYASVEYLPDLIDFPYRSDQHDGTQHIELYWLDDDGVVTDKRSVPVGPDDPDLPYMSAYTGRSAGGGAGSSEDKSGGWLPPVLGVALAAALAALAYLWFHQGEAGIEQVFDQTTEELQKALDAANAEIEKLEAKVESLEVELKEKVREWMGKEESYKSDLAQKDAEIAKLREQLGEAPGGTQIILTGLDHPPCWTRGESKQPDYLFTATISSAGIRLDKAFTAHDDAAYAALPSVDVPLGQELSIGQFRAAVEPIYFASVGAECRHFVRLVEGQHTNVDTYKAQRKAVEDHFYIYRPL